MAATSKFIIGLLFSLLIMLSPVAAVQTFKVTETDLVRLKAEAVDQDNDLITYRYSPPLNEAGEWQTGYEDAGEYDLNITAYDGVSTTTKKVKLIVRNRNRPPELISRKITVFEDQLIDLKQIVLDPDGDVISIVFEDPFDQSGLWTPNYRDSGSFVTTFTADDGTDRLEARVEIEVLSTNHAPIITDSFSEGKIVRASEDGILEFFADAEDVDEDSVSYLWTLDEKTISEEISGEIYFDYDSAGEHFLQVTVSDGTGKVTKEWEVSVENKNRKPELIFLPLAVHEGQRVTLNPPQRDIDGDILTYSFEVPLDERGEWQTGYEDAGEYALEVIAFDGKLFGKTKAEITVLNTDRAPKLISPEAMTIWEGEKAVWKIESDDPDGDKVVVNVEGLPAGAVFDAKKRQIEWRPDYSTVQRSGGKISSFLNTIRVENVLLRKKAFPLTIASCGEEACTTIKASIIVYNTNRGPDLTPLRSITIHENEEVVLEPAAVDPDGDVVHYYFTKPFGLRSGVWKPKTGQAGEYTIYVTATDGKIGQTEPVTVKVLKNNLAPSLQIKDDVITVTEDHLFSFAVGASDPNDDNISIRIENLPRGASFREGRFEWQPGFDIVMNKTSASLWQRLIGKSTYLTKKFSVNSADVWLRFTASDREAEAVHPVKITVKDVNRAPQIIDSLPAQETIVEVNEPVIFHVAVRDADRDQLKYTWDFDFAQEGAEGSDTIERTFLTSGVKKVRVTISDGFSEVAKEWKVGVQRIVEEPVVEEAAEPEEIPFTIRMYVLSK